MGERINNTVKFPTFAKLKKCINNSTIAVLLEPIQGEGGVIMPNKGYLKAVRALCDHLDVLLIFDEIQTGMGRTGKFFAFEQYGLNPDIVTLAKGLGGGVPVGAMLARNPCAAAFKPGDHGSTFGGNPLACAAANAVIDIIEHEGLLARVTEMGAYLGEQLARLVTELPGQVTEVRGRGLLRGIAVTGQPAQITARCRERGLLVSIAGANVVRFAPPYIIDRAHVDEAVAIVRGVLADGAGT
jgi:acetylornithine/N-succinyldiaminopimelate aminotransferase